MALEIRLSHLKANGLFELIHFKHCFLTGVVNTIIHGLRKLLPIIPGTARLLPQDRRSFCLFQYATKMVTFSWCFDGIFILQFPGTTDFHLWHMIVLHSRPVTEFCTFKERLDYIIAFEVYSPSY